MDSTYFEEVDRPAAVEMFFDNFSTIDIHDHYRQGSLALERTWHTRNWWHRIFSSPLMGIIFTDSNFAYVYEFKSTFHSSTAFMLTFYEFLDEFAPLMITKGAFELFKFALTLTLNVILTDFAYLMQGNHDLAPLSKHQCYAKIKRGNKPRRRCTVCGEQTSFYCIQCSERSHKDFVTVCNHTLRPHSTCYHIDTCSNK